MSKSEGLFEQLIATVDRLYVTVKLQQESLERLQVKVGDLESDIYEGLAYRVSELESER